MRSRIDGSVGTLTVEDLAERSGVSVRNVRFYATEGLLGSRPERGRFTEGQLDRLLLLKLLREDGVQIRSIAQRLGGLSDAEVAKLVDEASDAGRLGGGGRASARSGGPEFGPPATTESAAEYVRRVLRREAERDASADVVAARQPASRPRTGPSGPAAPEAWQRTVLMPGVELNVRLPLSAAARDLVERIRQVAGADEQSNTR